MERWSRGDSTALDSLIELAYDDLREIASRRLREWRNRQHTLQTTALVHELYLRLAGASESAWGGRAQFFAFCSKAMRRILIDFARRRQAAKRGGNHVRVALDDVDEAHAGLNAEVAEMLALDAALQRLALHNERMAHIVECRFFGDLSVAETAEVVGVSSRTVEREWARARAYLQYGLLANEDATKQMARE